MEMLKYLGRSSVMAKVIPSSHCDQYLTIRCTNNIVETRQYAICSGIRRNSDSLLLYPGLDHIMPFVLQTAEISSTGSMGFDGLRLLE